MPFFEMSNGDKYVGLHMQPARNPLTCSLGWSYAQVYYEMLFSEDKDYNEVGHCHLPQHRKRQLVFI